MLEDDREMIKSIVGEDDFLEIYMNSTVDTCIERDPKGLYKKARAGDKKVLNYLRKKPEGAILQNMIDDLHYHRFTIQKALYRLMLKGLVVERVYSQNAKVYWFKEER